MKSLHVAALALAFLLHGESPAFAYSEKLHLAIQSQDLATVKRLVLKQKLNLNDHAPGMDRDGAGYLHDAASVGNYDITKFLVEQGANVDFRDYYAGTPLMVAVGNDAKNLAVVKFLLAKGANKAAVNSQKLTALAVAKLNNFTAAVKLLDESR